MPKTWVKIERHETENEDSELTVKVEVKYNDNSKATFYENGKKILFTFHKKAI